MLESIRDFDFFDISKKKITKENVLSITYNSFIFVLFYYLIKLA